MNSSITLFHSAIKIMLKCALARKIALFLVAAHLPLFNATDVLVFLKYDRGHKSTNKPKNVMPG
ncbi:hypothetical protein [Vagococcus sp. WN89Y]|uniref:hypothetical protein n=1 Tax=Vagococcus sp. WN89Y TaxID=3457258 RepID=UPI003FCE30D7